MSVGMSAAPIPCLCLRPAFLPAGTGSKDEMYAFNKPGVTEKGETEETLGSSGADVAASVTDLLRVRRERLSCV